MLSQNNYYETFKETLNREYIVPQLKSLALMFSDKIPSRKSDLVDHISAIMLNKTKDVIDILNKDEKKVLSEAVYEWDGFYKPDQYKAKYGVSPIEKPSQVKNSMIPLHLFFIAGKIPRDLFNKISKLLKAPKAESLHYCEVTASRELIQRNTAHAACINLNILLNMVKENQIKVSKTTGRATAGSINAISSNLSDGDFYDEDEFKHIQAFAWTLLLQGGGLATISGNALKLTKKGETVLKKDLAGGIKAIWGKWEKTKIIDEFSRVTLVKGQKSVKGRVMTSPPRRRPVINEVLMDLEPGKWISIDEIDRFMRSTNRTFEMVNYDWKLYIGNAQYGLIDYYNTWPVLQVRYLLVYFFEYCATMGLIDIAYTHPDNARQDYQADWGDEKEYLSIYDGLMYIRLNDLGAYALDIIDNYTDSDFQKFEIDGTCIVYKDNDMPLPDHSIYLDKIGEQIDTGKWQLSSYSLTNAIKNNTSLKEITAFIKKTISDTPGKILEELFAEVNEKSASVMDQGNVTLLKCSIQIRKQILINKKLSSLCMPAGDRHIIILPGKNELFAKSLEALGIIIGK